MLFRSSSSRQRALNGYDGSDHAEPEEPVRRRHRHPHHNVTKPTWTGPKMVYPRANKIPGVPRIDAHMPGVECAP